MKKRKMTALQRRYFGKRHKAVHSRRKVKKIMGRRYIRARSYARRGYKSAGGFKGILAPIGGGLADRFLDPMLPIDGIGSTAVGMFMHNSTIKDIGLYKVGYSLGNILPIPGITGQSGGGLL